MTRLLLLLLLLLPLLFVAACSRPADPDAAERATGNAQTAAMEQSLDELSLAVRLKAAEGRIEQLERQVGALEATPQKLENELLTQRLQQLEARVYATGSTPAPAPARDTPAPPRPRAPDAASTPTPAAAPNRFNPFGL